MIGRLLLVSLLENFCSLYESPDQNRQLFQLICKQLSDLGIITEQDYLDGFGSIRGSYKRAFRELVLKALDSIKVSLRGYSNCLMSWLICFTLLQRNEQIAHSRHDTLTRTTSDLVLRSHGSPEILNNLLSKFVAPSRVPFRLVDDSVATALLENLNPTRYKTDFVELKCLGKGGFGSVWHVKHRLDGLEYAVKKVRLQNGRAYEKVWEIMINRCIQ